MNTTQYSILALRLRSWLSLLERLQTLMNTPPSSLSVVGRFETRYMCDSEPVL